MGVKSITFSTYFKYLKYYSPEEYPLEEDDILDDDDIENSNIDVFVELDDGYTYTVLVATAKYLDYLMNREQSNYLEPAYPIIIVRKLTREIIKETLSAYAEKNNGYWLKLYHFAADIDETVFKKLQAEHEAQIEADKAFEELYGDNDYPLYGGYESYGYESDGYESDGYDSYPYELEEFNINNYI